MNFRWIYDYSGGQVTDWGGHHPDCAQWGMGTERTGPVEIRNAKGVFPPDELWNTATEFYFEAIYAIGVKMIVSDKVRGGVTFEGSEGWVWANRGSHDAEPKSLLRLARSAPTRSTSTRATITTATSSTACSRAASRSRPVEVAHRSITICHLGNIAMRLGRDLLRWDPDKEQIVGDDEAARDAEPAVPRAVEAGGMSRSMEKPPETPAAHRPYVPDESHLAEFTWSAVVVGTLLGILFGASSLYLVLKVGMTVSASVPVAVLSITLFRVLARVFGLRRATILENNIVQTTGSAGESIAFGVGVTMPAVLLLGFELDPLRVLVVSVLGGVLGILMMIPLRRAFIVKRHGELKYPEGTACADVLIVGEQGGATAKTVFAGFGLAFVYQVLLLGLRLWKETPMKAVGFFRGAVASIEVNPTLLGVGYIIGTRVASIMLAGGLLAYFVFAPRFISSAMRWRNPSLREKC